jgi:hypothetical protein
LAKIYRCDHGSDAPELLVAQLKKSQGGISRHKCAICAYSRGRAGALSRSVTLFERCKHGSAAPKTLLADLPDSQAGPGIQRHKCCVCAYQLGFDAAAALSDAPHPDEVATPHALHEGAVRTVVINAYERNPIARQRCIEHYGHKCSVCKLHFETRYGPAFRGLIHVHHLRPLASLRRNYKVDPVKDLRPVCPNCHAMLHRQDPPYTIEQLRSILKV